MPDKSPRNSLSQKSGKSIKEKRADKRAKDDEKSEVEKTLHPKRH